jgi:hypothetical protein
VPDIPSEAATPSFPTIYTLALQLAHNWHTTPRPPPPRHKWFNFNRLQMVQSAGTNSYQIPANKNRFSLKSKNPVTH